MAPRRGASRSEAPRGQTCGGEPRAPPLSAGRSPEEITAGGDGDGDRRNPGVKKHHHKHNLKHRYELLETLGRGTYGKVKKAIERHSGREVTRYTYTLHWPDSATGHACAPPFFNVQ